MSMVFEHGVRRCDIAPPVSHLKSSVGNSQRQRTIQNDLSETSRCDNVALNFDWMCAVCMSWSCCCRRCQCLLVHKFNSNDSRPTDGKSTLDMRTNKCSISKTASAHMARRLGKVSWFALKCVTSDATHAISAKSLEKFCLFSFSLHFFALQVEHRYIGRMAFDQIGADEAQHNQCQSNRCLDDGHSERCGTHPSAVEPLTLNLRRKHETHVRRSHTAISHSSFLLCLLNRC